MLGRSLTNNEQADWAIPSGIQTTGWVFASVCVVLMPLSLVTLLLTQTSTNFRQLGVLNSLAEALPQRHQWREPFSAGRGVDCLGQAQSSLRQANPLSFLLNLLYNRTSNYKIR